MVPLRPKMHAAAAAAAAAATATAAAPVPPAPDASKPKQGTGARAATTMNRTGVVRGSGGRVHGREHGADGSYGWSASGSGRSRARVAGRMHSSSHFVADQAGSCPCPAAAQCETRECPFPRQGARQALSVCAFPWRCLPSVPGPRGNGTSINSA